MIFDLPGDRLPTPNKEEPDQNVKVSIHQGQMEEMIAMATINLEDIQVLVITYFSNFNFNYFMNAVELVQSDT